MRFASQMCRLGISAAALFLSSQASAQSDPADALRKEVMAVMVQGQGLLLQKPDGRIMRVGVGEVWRDGWRLDGVTLDTATLSKAGEARTVSLAAEGAASASRWRPTESVFDRAFRLGPSATSEQLVETLRQYAAAVSPEEGRIYADFYELRPGESLKVMTNAAGQPEGIALLSSERGRMRVITPGRGFN